jgi:hypothetical protein
MSSDVDLAVPEAPDQHSDFKIIFCSNMLRDKVQVSGSVYITPFH